MTTGVIQPVPADLPDKRKTPGLSPVLRPVLRKDVASSGPAWLPLVLVLSSFAAVAYADHLVVAISLVYLYLLPLALGAIFLRKEISYGQIEIVSGIKPDDQVIINPPDSIVSGQRVQIVQATLPGDIK
jgi:hypothetical protein